MLFAAAAEYFADESLVLLAQDLVFGLELLVLCFEFRKLSFEVSYEAHSLVELLLEVLAHTLRAWSKEQVVSMLVTLLAPLIPRS